MTDQETHRLSEIEKRIANLITDVNRLIIRDAKMYNLIRQLRDDPTWGAKARNLMEELNSGR